jgi:hypothetical protein
MLRAFAGGELAPSLATRADLAQYALGLRRCRNFLVHRHGGVSNRPGTRFVAACKTTTSNVRLLRYVHAEPSSSFLIEAGPNYLRFYLHDALVQVDAGDVDAYSAGADYLPGDLVVDGGSVFYAVAPSTGESTGDTDFWAELPDGVLEIPTPFVDTGLFNWHQSGETITFTHRLRPTHELIFAGLTHWIFRPVTTAPRVQPPENVALGDTSGTRSFGYVVTAAAPETYEESEASAQVIDAAAAEPTADAPHEISWDAQHVDGVVCPEYYIYCDPYANGTYGFIGTATGTTSFRNPGLVPDFSVTPPVARELFAAEGDYPHVSATYQQRRFFAQSVKVPDGVWGSRVGFPSNFGITSPLQDDDAVTFRVAGNDHHPVQHMLALKTGLVLMTAGGEWTARGPSGQAITPNGLEVEQETYVGAAEFVRPVPVGNGIIYAQARGSKVSEIKFDEAARGLGGQDLTVFAAHLFDGFSLVDMDYAYAPDSIVWAIRSDGTLLGLTYVPEQDVYGWHRHETAGAFERICVVPGEGRDDVYLVVGRVINGSVVRFIERLEQRTIKDVARDSFFVDAGLTYDGTPISTIAGLDHLNGATVDVVADGRYLGGFPVAGGAVTLGTTASVVHAGLHIANAEIETLSLDVAGSSVRARKKRVQAVDLVLDTSSRVFRAGPDATHLRDYRAPTYAALDAVYSGKVELSIEGTFDDDGRVLIRQEQPLPFTVLAIMPSVELGG